MRTNNRGQTASPFRYSPLVAALACVLAPAVSSAVPIMVTTSADSGTGSLREAINTAISNCFSEPNPVIHFDVGTGPFVIQPASAFPPIFCPAGPLDLTIDGTTQAGWNANTSSTGFDSSIAVAIDATSTFSYGGCLIDASDSYGYGTMLRLKGVEVSNFSAGPAVCGAVQVTGSRLVGNYMGASIYAPGSVGGPSAADRNVIGHNSWAGVEVYYGGTVDVINNLIGTDGTSAAGNDIGIMFSQSSGLIEGNVVSGNFGDGILVTESANVTVRGNLVGTSGNGSGALGNGNAGVWADCPTGPIFIQDNVIASNQYGGLILGGVNNALITNNKIGLGSDGVTNLGNTGAAGMTLSFGFSCGFAREEQSKRASAKAFQIGGSNANTIQGNKIAYASLPDGGFADGIVVELGGDNVFDGNVIFGNADSGVRIGTGDNTVSGNDIFANGEHGITVEGQGATGNSFVGNSIHGNGVKNVNLDVYGGALPNDLGDGDSGPNNLQNHPVISSVIHDFANAKTLVTWSLNSTPNGNFQVQFAANPGPTDPAGEYPLIDKLVSVDGAGDYAETTTIDGFHDHISMLATDSSTGDTSEYSAVVPATPSPGATLTPLLLSFGNVSLNETSAPLAAILKSVGTASYVIDLISSQGICYGGPPAPPPMCAEGEFSCTTTCVPGSPYANGQQCTFSGTFAPTTLGPQSATITVCDNATGSPRTLVLTGTGVPATTTLSPSSFDFGSIAVGSSSAPSAFLVKNPGSSEISISGPTVSGPFQIASTTCAGSIPAESSCEVNVQYVPTIAGNESGVLSVETASGPLFAGLSGRGTVEAILTYPRTAIDLGVTPLNGPSLMGTLPLSNTGNAALVISSIAIGSPFRLVHDCPPVLGAGVSCAVELFLDATAAGRFNNQLAIVTDAPGGSSVIPVTGLVQPRPEPVITIRPTAIGFGERMIGAATPPQQVTIRNDGGALATLDLGMSGFQFLLRNSTCGATLEPQASCTADVIFQPAGFGTQQGSLVVTSNDPGSPAVTSLSGVGCRPYTTVSRSARPSSNCSP